MAGRWFCDIDSCSSLPVLPDPAWVLLSYVMLRVQCPQQTQLRYGGGTGVDGNESCRRFVRSGSGLKLW